MDMKQIWPLKNWPAPAPKSPPIAFCIDGVMVSETLIIPPVDTTPFTYSFITPDAQANVITFPVGVPVAGANVGLVPQVFDKYVDVEFALNVTIPPLLPDIPAVIIVQELPPFCT